jgi:ribosomal-protein-alanine N-acetyltransferase
MSLTIEHLFEHPEHIPTVARWIHEEFWDGRPGHSVDTMAARLREATTANDIPLSLLALVDGQPAGTINLVENDDEERPHLRPWLAALLVVPEFRRRGIGARLVRELQQQAARLSISTMYLGTENPGYYSRLGARFHEQAARNIHIMNISALPTHLRTSRLILRRWTAADRDPFAQMNADPRVMEFFPSTYTRDYSDAVADRIESHFAEKGFGLWAVEIPDIVPFAGFVGLSTPPFEAHFTPCVEIGWRLATACWGHGYATEAARAALAFGFDALGLHEIVALTAPDNLRSRRVMERIGMIRNPADDFDHPLISEGHPLRRCILYRIARPDWQKAGGRK